MVFFWLGAMLAGEPNARVSATDLNKDSGAG
jgi:hypothetical protein